MQRLLEFIDLLCLDDRLYWQVPSVQGIDSGNPTIEVQWQRDAKPAAWRVRRRGEATWQNCAAPALARLLAETGADSADFERQLGVSIMTQAVLADMVREGAVRLFGEDAVNRSVQDTRAFLGSIAETAQKMLRAGREDQAPDRHSAAARARPRRAAVKKLRLIRTEGGPEADSRHPPHSPATQGDRST